MKNHEGILARLRPVFLAMHRFRAPLLTLSVIVVFITSYLLILPALTLDKDVAREQGGIDVTSSGAKTDGDAAESNLSVESSDSEDTHATSFAHTLSYKGDDYTVTVTCDDDAGISDHAILSAKELDSDSKEYQKYYNEALKKTGGIEEQEAVRPETVNKDLRAIGLELNRENTGIQMARFFDIRILVEGKEVEPEAPVQVKIGFDEPVKTNQDIEAQIVHFADDGVELIAPKTTFSENSSKKIDTFAFTQSSFSITATLLKYTGEISPGKYVIIKSAKENNVTRYYALKADGSKVEITKNGDTYSGIDDDCSWTFTKNNDGSFSIENDLYYSWLTLYNNVTGTWNQPITVAPSNNNACVSFKNPGTNVPLRWDGTNKQFVLGQSGGNSDSFYIARVNSDIEHGTGDDLKPAGETGLGDLEAWRDKIANSKIVAEKAASVADYDNRIYKIDLKALSDVTILSHKVDLELIVDTSRSMYFPATLEPVSGAVFNKINGTDRYSLTEVVKGLDKSKVYYFIGDGEKATVYALYYGASGTNKNDTTYAEHWRYVDASYINPPDAASMNQSDTINKLVGRNIEDFNTTINMNDWNNTVSRIYTSPDGITRLAYLKEAVRIASEIVYAVDRDSRIGLVTFNKKATLHQGFTNYANRQQLYNKINSISLAGGTRQDLGIETGIGLFGSARADAQKVAVLITDGAPNMQYDNGSQVPSDTAWQWIGEKADILKGPDSSNALLYTLGLSMNMVGGNNSSHLNGLASEEDGVTRHFNAENGTQIAEAIKSLIETLIYEVDIEGEVTDVLDPAFYPVDQSGNPIEEGTYHDQDGTEYKWEKVVFDGVEHWKVTYPDQPIGKGEKNDDGSIKTPGWQKSFFAKAKEDFLGGNNINTNRNKRSCDHVEAKKLVYVDRGTHQQVKIDPPNSLSWGKFTSPYVNVDELHLTENSSTWTVYKDNVVTPEEQMQELWDQIFVKQVVKADGTVPGDKSRMIDSDQKYYQKTDAADTESPTGKPNEDYAAIKISDYVAGTEIDWTSMLNSLKNQDSVEKTITYPGYGHNPGTITVKLEKEILKGQDAASKTPGQHVADEAGTPAETYKITVTYNPQTDNIANIGDPVMATGEDQVISENEHIINVFAKGLHITKTDLQDQVLTGAKFVLYRTARAGDDTAKIKTPAGLTGNYYPAAELDTSANGMAQLYPVGLLEDGEEYYLVEEVTPAGYNTMDPIKVTLDLHNRYRSKPDGQWQSQKPASGIYDWEQTASLTLDTSQGVKQTDAGGTEITNTGVAADSEDEIMYYRIPNNPGVELPYTGGAGTKVFRLIGFVMVLGAGVLLLLHRRRRVNC